MSACYHLPNITCNNCRSKLGYLPSAPKRETPKRHRHEEVNLYTRTVNDSFRWERQVTGFTWCSTCGALRTEDTYPRWRKPAAATRTKEKEK